MARSLGGLLLVLTILLGPCFVQPSLRPSPRRCDRARGQVPRGAAQRAPTGDEVIKFGKHKGKKTLRQVVEQDPGYVAWILKNIAHQAYAQPLISYIEASRSMTVPAAARRELQNRELRRAVAAAPEAAAAKTAKTAPRRIPEGPNADFYELPRNILDGFQLWSCPGKDGTPDEGDPFVYNMKGGWRFVGRVIAKRRVAVNFQDPSAVPADRNCKEMDVSDMSTLEFAKYVAALLEEEGRQDPADTRKVNYKGGRVEVAAKIRFRGVVLLDGHPYLTPVLDQEIYAPPEWNLGKQSREAMASLVGLKVQPLGPKQRWFDGLVVCNESVKTLTLDEQSRLLDLIKTEEVKTATEEASLGELVLVVSQNCSSESSKLKMDFVASALRPCLNGQEEKLRQVKGFEDWRGLPVAKMTMTPSERQETIQARVTHLTLELFGQKAQGIRRMEEPRFFQKLQEPRLIYGNGEAYMKGEEKPSRFVRDLQRKGAFDVTSHGSQALRRPLRLQGVIFGRASKEERAAAEEILRSMSESLRSFGLRVTEQSELTVRPGMRPQELREVLEASELNSQDAVLFFRSSSMSESKMQQFHLRSKYECFRSTGSQGQHIASQWFDLSKKNLWRANVRAFRFGLEVSDLALLAKLGHTPWAISAENWGRGRLNAKGANGFRPAVVGYDVCHLQDKRRPSKRHHVAAAIRVESRDSESEPLILSRVSFQTERVQAETVPPESLRQLIPADFARGKLVILHRDGKFPLKEIQSLGDYHAELHAEDPQTTFILVECIKWAGGSPRLYDGKKSAKAGTMFKFHDKEVLLSSTKDLVQGTANPINARLAKVFGAVPDSFALDDFAWAQSVYDLSYMHHGSVQRRPRLPITTHFADRLAYVLASAGEDGAEWDRELAEVAAGNQQFWL